VKWVATTRSLRYHCAADLNGENSACDRVAVLGVGAPAIAAAVTPPAAAPRAMTLSRNAIAVGGQDRGYAYYVSSKYNPTGYNFVVYALHDNGQTAEQFAQQSGWRKLAEDNGFVVVFPEAANKTWATNSGGEDAYLKAVYDHASTHLMVAGPAGAPAAGRGGEGGAPRGGEGGAARGGEGGGAQAGPPRGGEGAPRGRRAQTWQPFNYLTGAGAGAIAAQEFAINHPGVYAAVATLDGLAYDAAYARGDEPAQGYFQNQRGGKNAKPVWKQLKKEVPVATWLFTTGAPTPAEAKLSDYWKRGNAASEAAPARALGGFQTTIYRNPTRDSQQVRTTTLPATATYDEAMASAIWNDLFKHVARWTSSPNGDLGPVLTEEEVNKAFDVRTLTVDGTTYKYFAKLPSTYRKGQSLPLVIAAHGAMYPAWLYLSQIRMHDVGEKEGFITVYIAGQNNRWDFTRADGTDAKFVQQVIGDVEATYGVDRSRVYMQGFSFGSGLTYMMGIAHPRLFAAVSPNNGIGPMSPEVLKSVADLKAKGDVRIPMMIVYGAVDGGGSTDGKIPAQGVLRGAIDEMKQYNRISTPDKVVRFDSPNSAPYDVLVLGGKTVGAAVGPTYPAGRFQVTQYASSDPTPLNLFSFVWVTDLPHGGDAREAQFEWDYFKHWRRNADGSLTYSAR
jgi:poly(3-hydroxybutyrate) depolymerase